MKTRPVALIFLSAIAACDPQYSDTGDSIASSEYPLALEALYAPGGWMGDAQAGEPFIYFDRNYRGLKRPGDHDGPVTRVQYSTGPAQWASHYWQWPKGNWGETPGRSLSASRVSFFARGELGGEFVTFGVGGLPVDGERLYPDSVDRSSGGIRLEQQWRRYAIDLRNEDLSSVIGGFSWTVQARANVLDPVVFFLDEVTFE